MEFKITTEEGSHSGETIKEDALDQSGFPFVRKWKISQEHPKHKGGFLIKNGSCTRIIFPADFLNYYV